MLATVDPLDQRTQFLECEATLVRQIATRHGVSADDVRASTDAK
jgi:hypothetical protein